MKNKKQNNLTPIEELIDKEYGKRGTLKREKFEQEFEAFKIGVLIQEARKKQHLTQEELAEKVGTTKNYISRVENNTANISLHSLTKIIQEGLGGKLELSLKL